jgi:hypothetical protein
MDMRRFLPIILIVFVALFILPQLLKGGRGKTLSAKDRGVLTLDAMNRVDQAEQKVFKASGRYTASLAELVAADKVLASELTIPLDVTLDIGPDGKSYVAQLTSDVFSVAGGRDGEKVTTRSCREVKTTSGVDCPDFTGRPTTTTITTTTPTETRTSTTGTVTVTTPKPKK